ncbi:hypothetical protein ACHWQZ_G014632 [Mnemiopsis leidyi]
MSVSDVRNNVNTNHTTELKYSPALTKRSLTKHYNSGGMVFKIFLFFSMVFARSVGQNTEDGVYGEDATFILNQPVAINARKMSKALNEQGVVATCRYLLYKTYLDWYGAKDSCRNVTLPMTLKTRGSMATVKTEAENKDLVTLMKLAYGVKYVGKKYDRRNWVWLGMEKVINNDKKLPKKQVGEKFFNSSEWRWVDGSEPVWWNWQKKMPDQEIDKKTKLPTESWRLTVLQSPANLQSYRVLDTYSPSESWRLTVLQSPTEPGDFYRVLQSPGDLQSHRVLLSLETYSLTESYRVLQTYSPTESWILTALQSPTKSWRLTECRVLCYE